jgi:hypothetical protein
MAQGLSRRGFLGAAAGTALAAGAGTPALASWRPREHPAKLPKYRIGIQCYTVRNAAAMGNGSPAQSNPAKTNQWLDTIIDQYENLAVESYGDNYGSLSQADWRAAVEARGAYTWGDHAGGNLSTPAGLDAAVARVRNLGTREIGTASDDALGVNAGGEYNAQNFLNGAQNMNDWGRALQERGLRGVRYYFHPHHQSYAVITDANNSGLPQHNGKRLMDLIYENIDPRYAFVQTDLAWARHHDALGTNEEYLAFLNRHEDLMEAYHVKGMSGMEEIDCQIPEDLVPWEDFFSTLRHPGRKTYLWERDGPGSGLSDGPLLTSFQRFHDLLHDAALDRSVIGAPGNAVPPKIAGSGKAGKVLVVAWNGKWTRAGNCDFSFRWLRNGLPIPGADDEHYRTERGDAGKEIVCEVTARNRRGSTPENSNAVVLR